MKVDLDDKMAMKKRLTRVKTEWGVSSADVMTLDENIADLNNKVKNNSLFFFGVIPIIILKN
jgi:hypothetical protein